MIIQKIQQPNSESAQLYYRELDSLRRDKAGYEKKETFTSWPIHLTRGRCISFGTYVNALSCDMIYDNTKALDISIVIRATGDIRIQVYNSVGVRDEADDKRHAGKREIDTDIFGEMYNGYKQYTVHLGENRYDGIIYPVVEALEDCMLLGAEYITGTPIDASDVRLAVVICYNKDAKSTKHNIDMVANFAKRLQCDIPIIICDMTANLNEETFTDANRKISQIATSQKTGDSYNKALTYIRENYGGYTHAILIDKNTELSYGAMERLYNYLSVLDDIRDDMIIQGDVFSNDTYNEGAGYLIYDMTGHLRHRGYDMGLIEDVVSAMSSDEIDYFKSGLLCIPLKEYKPFNPRLHFAIELDYYLRHKPLSIMCLNGFFAYKSNRYDDGIVKDYYYRYRDDYIARVNTDMEVGKDAFKKYVTDEYNREVKKGNIYLAYTIIEATEDFLSGPKILDKDVETKDKIHKLTSAFNDNIIGRRSFFKERFLLHRKFTQLIVMIEREYDLIMDRWHQSEVY